MSKVMSSYIAASRTRVDIGPRVPGANGQGETCEECLASIRSAVLDLLAMNRAEAIGDDPAAEVMELALA